MSVVQITENVVTVEVEVEHLTTEQVFAAITAGNMTFDQFEEWDAFRRSEAYSDGSFNQSFYGMNYDD